MDIFEDNRINYDDELDLGADYELYSSEGDYSELTEETPEIDTSAYTHNLLKSLKLI